MGALPPTLPVGHHLHWDAEALWHQLQPVLPGLSVEVAARLGSTNTTLVERARRSAGGNRATDWADAGESGPPGGRRQADRQACLLVAETQTQGRGRQGKTWHAALGASLTFSLSLPLAPADWSGLSLAVGMALADALDPPTADAPPALWLKWPNDLLLREAGGPGRKLGGILIETVPVADARVAVIGIGLNVLPQSIPDALPWGHADLQALHPGITAPQVLARVARPLVQAVLDFARQGFAPLQPAFARRDALFGQAVTTTLAQVPGGIADGVDAQGMLWLRQGDRRTAVGSGEVSLAWSGVASASATPGGDR
jgi:BirA family transcriptional regulator, biotin operon repressor / biotin---[acetyl-CoA-carboxylase] ligase